MNLFVFADIDSLLYKITAKVINPLIEFLFIIALVIFLWGVVEYIRGADSQDKRNTGKQHMMWGVIGFVIMFGVFGIINILLNTFGIKGYTINNKQQTYDPSVIQIRELKLPQ